MSGSLMEPLSLGALLHGHDRPLPGTTLAHPGSSAPIGDDPQADAARAIIDAGRRMDQLGWVPATAGNLSIRLDADTIAITRSGCHKGMLNPADVMLVDSDGAALTEGRPSAETLLHCQIYQLQPQAGAVLHGHSIAATVLSMHTHTDIVLQGYEVQKAFAGQRTHTDPITLPVWDNDQDIARLAATIAPRFAAGMPAGYCIRGHGVYAWGPDMDTAMVRLEALEFLLACELQRACLT